MFALEVSWYIVYQSILAIAQKSLLCIREFVVVADPAVSWFKTTVCFSSFFNSGKVLDDL